MSKTYTYTYTKPTLEVFDVKVSKDILTEEAWGFIVTINSQTLYDHNYRYKMDVYVDGNNVGDSPCDKVSEGVVQFQCIYTGPVSNIQIIINYVSNLIFKGPLHIHIHIMYKCISLINFNHELNIMFLNWWILYFLRQGILLILMFVL